MRACVCGSTRGWSEAVQGMLNLNRPLESKDSKPGAGDDAWSSDWKVLIFDAFCRWVWAPGSDRPCVGPGRRGVVWCFPEVAAGAQRVPHPRPPPPPMKYTTPCVRVRLLACVAACLCLSVACAACVRAGT